MKGYVYVSPQGVETDEMLADWVARGVAFATTIPAKAARPRRSSPRA